MRSVRFAEVPYYSPTEKGFTIPIDADPRMLFKEMLTRLPVDHIHVSATYAAPDKIKNCERVPQTETFEGNYSRLRYFARHSESPLEATLVSGDTSLHLEGDKSYFRFKDTAWIDYFFDRVEQRGNEMRIYDADSRSLDIPMRAH